MICLFFLASPKQYLDFGIDPSCITAEQHYITYSHTEQNTSEGHYEMSPKDVSFVRNQGCLDVSGQNDSFPIDRSPRCSWRRNPWRSCSPGKRPAREGKQRKDYQRANKDYRQATAVPVLSSIINNIRISMRDWLTKYTK